MSERNNPPEWDATGYDALPLPHVEWGRRTLVRLPLRGDETVLELGCGTGRDTEALLAALPHGRVIALDGSAQMVTRTQERCSDAGERMQTMQADLRHPLELADDSETPSSASPRSTGFPTTPRSSPSSAASCGRAGGWPSTTAAPAT